jgi:GT2 family glycosyltransferase
LDSLTRQDIPPSEFEVIVVDDGSTDDSWDRLNHVETPFSLRILRQANQGPGEARNTAIKEALGEIIITLDDDVVAQPDLLRRHLEAHQREPGIAAIGVMAPPDGARLAPWLKWELTALSKQYEAMINGWWEPTPRQFYTANASARRAAFLEAGLFDPFFRRSEDIELAFRMQKQGIAFRFLPDAIVYHEPPRSFAAWKKVAWSLGYYDAAIWRKLSASGLSRRIGRMFGEKRKSVQLLTRALVGRQALLSTFTASTAVAARLMGPLHLNSLQTMSYSAVFTVHYWQGVCDGIGSREELWSRVDARQVDMEVETV